MAMSIRAGSHFFSSRQCHFSFWPTTMPKPLPFSLEELRQQVDQLDFFVKTATVQVMKKEMGPSELGFSSLLVDELAHLHGLLDLVRCCVEEIGYFDD